MILNSHLPLKMTLLISLLVSLGYADRTEQVEQTEQTEQIESSDYTSLKNDSLTQLKPRPLTEVTLLNGQELVGEVTSENDQSITLLLSGSTSIEIKRSDIKTIKTSRQNLHEGTLQVKDPAISRSFYTPTAFMLDKGTFSFSQKELLFSSIGYGVTDYFSIQAGAAVPFWWIDEGQNLILGAKAGASVHQYLHLAIGFQEWFFSEAELSMPFFTGTVGSEKINLTLNYSPMFTSESSNHLNFFSTNLYFRLNNKVAIISENWFFDIDDISNANVNSIGVRIFGKNLSADLGFFFFSEIDFPLPWVNFNYNW